MRTVLKLMAMSAIFTGCVYHPQTVDIPLINHKKDLSIDAGLSSGISVHGSVAYGLTEHIALQAFGSYGPDENHYFQGAVGVFKSFENNKIAELYSGYGYGYGDAYLDAHPGNLYGNYQQYFVQMNFGSLSSSDRAADFGFGLKTGLFRSNFTDRNFYSLNFDGSQYSTYKDNSLLLEPGLFTRLGANRMKFTIKAGTCLMYKFTNRDKYIPYARKALSFGFNYSL
ncbi:MAG: hypothetical protein OEX02_19840 [Cyclobacteriaceae bacterium]|nr:hypothetical protein [Cyclobacteriaceae bacterium]